MGKETTDIALSIRTSDEEINNWDRSRIVNALLKETNVNLEIADTISIEVENQIFSSSIKTITTSLVRELVNAKLMEKGLEKERLKHDRLGVPLYDVEQIITNANNENSNVPHGPEATNLTLAGEIKKEFALRKVYSKEVADAHLRGDIHIHDLSMAADRPYCSGQSIEFIKKFGLNLPNSLAIAKPAKQPEVLLAHMIKFAAVLQCHYAGAIGWDAVNLFFAPYLVGLSKKQIKQLAQMLIFEFSQQAVARGGQAIFSDINLYWEIPKHFENTPAIGPGGVYTGKLYKDYIKESQEFITAIFEVYLEGDGCGRPFIFPKPLLHITEKLFKTPGHEKFLNHVCNVASKMGNPYFVFDRGSTAKISECCRLSFLLTDSDLDDAKYPWKMRYCALQNVSINLPRIGLSNKGQKVFDKITKNFNLMVKAHIQKLKFIKKILALGDKGPLGLLTMNKDGDPYLKVDKMSYLIGMVGLNELVKTQIGKEMHKSKEALKYGLKIIAHMKLLADKAFEEYGMHFVLEQSPAESTSHRFARLDLKKYGDKAKNIVQGNTEEDSVYYTNSTQFSVGAEIDIIDRVQKEGLFHPLIEAGSLCLDYNENIPLHLNNIFSIVRIGDFVETAIKNNINKITSLADGTIQVPIESSIKTFGVNNQGGKLVNLTHAVKIPIKNRKMYEICTEDSKKVKVTEDHILFRINNGNILEVKSQNLKKGDVILAQPKINDTEKELQQINIFKYLLCNKENIAIIDEEGDIKKYLLNNKILVPKCLYKKVICLEMLKNTAPDYPIEDNLNKLKWRYIKSSSKLPFIFDINYDLGVLLGFLLSEGSLHKAINTGSDSISFSIHQKETEFAHIIKNSMKSIFNKEITFVDSKFCKAQYATTSDKSLYYLFSEIFDIGKNSFYRKIPNNLFILNKEYLHGIVDGIFAGDGLKANRPNQTSISVTSSILVSQLQLIFSFLGIKYTRSLIKPLDSAKNNVHSLYIGSAGFKKLLINTPLYKKYLYNSISKSLIDTELISQEATPFITLYNKYLKGKNNIFVDRKNMIKLTKIRRGRICIDIALKYCNSWVSFLNSILNDTNLIRTIYKQEIAFDLNISNRTVERVFKLLKNSKNYVKNNYFSKNTFVKIENFNCAKFIQDINNDINLVNTFKSYLQNLSFTFVKSIKEIKYSNNFAYDITVDGHKFSNLDGIACHNTHCFLGESKPSPESLSSFVYKVFKNTKNDQIAFSPEFTCCLSCNTTARGLLDKCPNCGSEDIELITRITGYFSKVSGWNKGKIAELKDRVRNRFE